MSLRETISRFRKAPPAEAAEDEGGDEYQRAIAMLRADPELWAELVADVEADEPPTAEQMGARDLERKGEKMQSKETEAILKAACPVLKHRGDMPAERVGLMIEQEELDQYYKRHPAATKYAAIRELRNTSARMQLAQTLAYHTHVYRLPIAKAVEALAADDLGRTIAQRLLAELGR